MLNTIPMERYSTGRINEMEGSLEIARSILDRGYSLVFSPEGTRSLIPLEERQLHRGPADLALQGGYPIIPVRLKGFDSIMSRGQTPKLLNGLHRWHVSVSFGETITVPKVDDRSARIRERKNLTRFLKERLLQM